ncbi:MAG: hypothetical protein FWH22_03785, partial [Fibromonadales bacterium]|nr:hypothetical protein [Fibromonadales bacterium]
MKTLKIGFCLILVLTAQTFAQRFTASEPEVFQTGFNDPDQYIGYHPTTSQTAALGEKNSSFANLMLLAGRDTVLNNVRVGTYNIVNSYGNVIGTVLP